MERKREKTGLGREDRERHVRTGGMATDLAGHEQRFGSPGGSGQRPVALVGPEGPANAVRGSSEPARPDPEVLPTARRRTYSAKYKLEILQKAEALGDTGDIGALLRREGLYYSHLRTWRRQQQEGSLAGLHPKKRGPKPDPDRELRRRNEQLEKENRKLALRLEKAELIIEVQKRISRILGIDQLPYEPEGKKS